MYSIDILRVVSFMFILYITKVFKWRTLLTYASLSALFTILRPGRNMPELILLYMFEALIAYLVYGVIAHQIRSKRAKKSVSAVPRSGLKISINSILSIFTIGYFFMLIGTNEYISFFATIVLFFAVDNSYYSKLTTLWNAGFVLSILHSLILFSGSNLVTPAYFTGIYLLIMYLFFVVRDAFSVACIPEELKEGMIPAEGIVYDGKVYLFGIYPIPTLFGLLRYVTGDKILKRRVVASFFVPLQKKEIIEIRRILKQHNKNIFLVQKQIDFMPFLILGALAAYVL